MKMMNKKEPHIYLFRHGQTTFNRDGKFTGWLDPKLTPKGKKDAIEVARFLKNKRFKVAFQTSLIRSQETLKEVLKFHPECKTIKTDDKMIERNYGLLNGMSHEEFIKKIGKKLYKLEVEGDAITDLSKKSRKKVEKFLGEEEYELIHRGYDTRPPKGESFADVEKRVSSFIRSLKEFMKKEKTNVAISAHGNSIRLFRKIWENKTKEQAIKWVIPYDKVFTYKVKI
jgi:2,3-bisphosphoglycerate-dependent phosphoglycerate mutase